MVARQKSPSPCKPVDEPKTYSAISRGRKQLPYGDHVVNTWSDDGYVYMASCDDVTTNRNVSIWRLGAPGVSSYIPNGNVPIPTTMVNSMDQWGQMAENIGGSTWKATGLVSVNGKLYLALTRFVFPGDGESGDAQIFVSSNHGDTWAPQPPSVAAPMASPQFPGLINNCPMFFIHGQNNTIVVNRSNDFVYALSSGEPWLQARRRKLGRCLITNFDNVTTHQYWQYYRGGDGLLDSNWSSDGSLASWENAKDLLHTGGDLASSTPPFASSSVQPQWFPNYKGGRYIWIASGYIFVGGVLGPQWNQFWESPTPWGPWVEIGAHSIEGTPANAASTVVSGQVTGFGKFWTFPNFIATSVNATANHATAVIASTGDYTTLNAPNFPNPPIDPGEYQMHVAYLELSAGVPIVAEPIPPGITPAAPVITGVSPNSGPVGTAVTISGSNFGNSGTVTFNGITAGTSGWTPTSISTSVPIGATSGNVIVTTGGQASNPSHFTVDVSPLAPSITSLSPNAGPVGTVVNITGTNFGSSGTVTFNGITGSPTSWTATTITVPVPIGATTGNVIVTVSGLTSNAQPFTVPQPGEVVQIGFAFDSGSQTSLSATFGNAVPTTAGNTVVVAYLIYNHTVPVAQVTDNLGNSYSVEFSQTFPSGDGVGTNTIGVAVGLNVSTGGMLTATITFAGAVDGLTMSIAEFKGPMVSIDGHVSNFRSDASDTWSTGSIAVAHNSLLAAFGWSSKQGGGSSTSIAAPFTWSLYNGGDLITPPIGSIAGQFTITNVSPGSEAVEGSAAGLVVLRLS